MRTRNIRACRALYRAYQARIGRQMDRMFTQVASRVAALMGQPLAFIVALLVVVLWGASGPLFSYSDTWQLVINTGTTIATFLMVFLIQNSQNRDAAAMQAKLDELIRSTASARGQFIGIEHLTDRQIEDIRGALEAEAGSRKLNKPPPQDSVDRLLDRY
jgi:low affinity Fe/Cu permease